MGAMVTIGILEIPVSSAHGGHGITQLPHQTTEIRGMLVALAGCLVSVASLGGWLFSLHP
jgi:hypothetical protein